MISENFKNKWKFVQTSIFWTLLLIVIIWVYCAFQYCCIFSFLVDSVSKFIALTWACRVNLADLSWGGWVFRGSGEKKGFSIVALSSFILYFEFCVQILVVDWSNNIRTLRNQFQMLFVTNGSWKFGVGRKGGYWGFPLKTDPCFSPGLILFPSFAAV